MPLRVTHWCIAPPRCRLPVGTETLAAAMRSSGGGGLLPGLLAPAGKCGFSALSSPLHPPLHVPLRAIGAQLLCYAFFPGYCQIGALHWLLPAGSSPLLPVPAGPRPPALWVIRCLLHLLSLT